MAIEELKQGRATIDLWAESLVIRIPSKKRIFLIVFLGAWLGGWAFGEIIVPSQFFQTGAPAGVDFFLLFWWIGWTAGGAWAIYTFAWNIAGKEVITVSCNTIKIEKVVLGIRRGKEYLLESVKNFRIDQSGYSLFDWNKSMEMWGLSGGMIKFDYGMKTVRFAIGVDEAEANYILKQINNHIGLSK